MFFGVGVEIPCIQFNLLAELLFLEVPDVFRLRPIRIHTESFWHVQSRFQTAPRPRILQTHPILPQIIIGCL